MSDVRWLAAPQLRRILSAAELGTRRFGRAELAFQTSGAETLVLARGSTDQDLDRAEAILRDAFTDSPRRVFRYPAFVAVLRRIDPDDAPHRMPPPPDRWTLPRPVWRALVHTTIHDARYLTRSTFTHDSTVLHPLLDDGWVMWRDDPRRAGLRMIVPQPRTSNLIAELFNREEPA